MRVVGLISGGKDSIWNLHYCHHLGHQLVCVANLAPPAGIDEMDSYMYQTVASDVIEAIADALEVPLIRRVIAGAPKGTSSQSYTPQEGDEVEDLTLLLKEVIEKHPEVEAVSCGAILSNYQRLRVEDVCGRLGLKVLAFMWKQDQALLLQQMIDAGLDARIAKVACMGLTQNDVGASILDPAFSAKMFGLGKKWGVHVCGEGGEYESTVVDGPLFRKSIQIDSMDKIDHPDGNDGVSWLHVNKTSVSSKSEAADWSKVKDVLDPYTNLQCYQDTFPILTQKQNSPAASTAFQSSFTGEAPSASSLPRAAVGPVLRSIGGGLSASSSLDATSMSLPESTGSEGGSAAEAAALQCDELLAAITKWLTEIRPEGRGLRDVVLAEVQVRDLSCFEALNKVYAKYFAVEPPPRLCIQTVLPKKHHLRVRLLMQTDPEASCERLRVQSISTWAMACIGPYSQAALVNGNLMTAGVLGLTPHSMIFPKAEQVKALRDDVPNLEDYSAETWLMMRSLNNVLVEMRSCLSAAYLVDLYVSERCLSAAARAEQEVRDYIQREDPEANPLVTLTVVPRLPKDGLTEVAFTCGSKSSQAAKIDKWTVEANFSDAFESPCHIEVQGRQQEGAGTVLEVGLCFAGNVAEIRIDSSAVLSSMVKQCIALLKQHLQETYSIGSDRSKSLIVKHVIAADSGEEALAAAVLEEATSDDGFVVSFMPVTSLPVSNRLLSFQTLVI
mmetsp:Transcript_51592/g.109629  ORF Transcript_51592/g.109629 Transcript_51592/m.109629 type:complete len:727 (-) Transcript_51592:63-2243(-)